MENNGTYPMGIMVVVKSDVSHKQDRLTINKDLPG